MRNHALTQKGDSLARGVSDDVSARGCSRWKLQVAAPRDVLCLRYGGDPQRSSDSERNGRGFHRLNGGVEEDAAGVCAGGPSVDTPLSIPLRPLRIWMFFMLGSERNPIPSSLRLGSVITNALSLEIWFFCWL